MKNLITLIVFILTLTTGYGQSNVYHPFPDSNAFWANMGGTIIHPDIVNRTRYGLKGDTIINNKTYHQVYYLVDSTLSNPSSVYYAAIREEDKKVYTRIGNEPERILYDFGMNIGDSIIYYTIPEPYYDVFARVLTAIDSVQLRTGEYRKRFYLSRTGDLGLDDVVIEGIGSIEWIGLFNPLEEAIPGCCYEIFTCFKQNDIVYYLNNPECDHCFCTLLTDVTDIKKIVNVSFSPNPFSQIAVLHADYDLNNATLTLFNSFGQKVKQVTSITGNTYTLKRGNLPNGIYFYQISENNRIFATEKLIISNW